MPLFTNVGQIWSGSDVRGYTDWLIGHHSVYSCIFMTVARLGLACNTQFFYWALRPLHKFAIGRRPVVTISEIFAPKFYDQFYCPVKRINAGPRQTLRAGLCFFRPQSDRGEKGLSTQATRLSLPII